MANKLNDLTGRTFERLTVTGTAQPIGGLRAWACLCVCGTKATVKAKYLLNGTTRSCGCLRVVGIAKHPKPPVIPKSYPVTTPAACRGCTYWTDQTGCRIEVFQTAKAWLGNCSFRVLDGDK